MKDYSFIRLKPSFVEAIDMEESNGNELTYYDQIKLLPNEYYSFITNVAGGIAFNGNYRVTLINCNQEELVDITNNVFIEEIISNIDGSAQLKWEVININQDFYCEPVFFKFEHTVSNLVWYSNPINVTEYEKEYSKRFDFKNYQNLDGTCYEVAEIKQSVRLTVLKDRPNITSQSQQYTTLKGKKVSSRVIKSPFINYVMDNSCAFIYERLQYLLCHDEVYIDGIKVTDKQTFENEERYSFSVNTSKNKFKVAVDYNDTYSPELQVFSPDYTVIDRFVPHLSASTLATFNVNLASGLFVELNTMFEVSSDFNYKLYKDGVLVFTSSEYSLEGNKILLTGLSGYTFSNGEYDIVIDSNLIGIGGYYWAGFALGQWTFSISNGDWLNTDWNNSDFFTN